MKLAIKKSTVLVIVFLACVSTGVFLLQIAFESIGRYGLAGYVNLAIFSVSLVFIIYDLKREKDYKKMIEETVEEVSLEYGKDLNAIELGNYKEELRNHLKNKFDNETYKII